MFAFRLFLSVVLAGACSVACGLDASPADAPAAAEASDLRGKSVVVTDADVARAEQLRDLQIFVTRPKVSARAATRVLDDGQGVLGPGLQTALVKDADGRLLYHYFGSADVGSEGGSGGTFHDDRWFVVLDDVGLAWFLAQHYPRVPNGRSGQVLASMDIDKDAVHILADKNGTKTILFASELFLVDEAHGFADACREPAGSKAFTGQAPFEENQACAKYWLRVDASGDGDAFDVGK